MLFLCIYHLSLESVRENRPKPAHRVNQKKTSASTYAFARNTQFNALSICFRNFASMFLSAAMFVFERIFVLLLLSMLLLCV